MCHYEDALDSWRVLVEKPLVLVPAWALANEALTLDMSCPLPRCQGPIGKIRGLFHETPWSNGSSGPALHSSIWIVLFLEEETSSDIARTWASYDPFTRCVAAFVVRGGWAVRHPTACLRLRGARFALTSGSRMSGTTGVETGDRRGFQMLGVPSTAGPPVVLVDLTAQGGMYECSAWAWWAALTA